VFWTGIQNTNNAVGTTSQTALDGLTFAEFPEVTDVSNSVLIPGLTFALDSSGQCAKVENEALYALMREF